MNKSYSIESFFPFFPFSFIIRFNVMIDIHEDLSL